MSTWSLVSYRQSDRQTDKQKEPGNWRWRRSSSPMSTWSSVSERQRNKQTEPDRQTDRETRPFYHRINIELIYMYYFRFSGVVNDEVTHEKKGNTVMNNQVRLISQFEILIFLAHPSVTDLRNYVMSKYSEYVLLICDFPIISFIWFEFMALFTGPYLSRVFMRAKPLYHAPQ